MNISTTFSVLSCLVWPPHHANRMVQSSPLFTFSGKTTSLISPSSPPFVSSAAFVVSSAALVVSSDPFVVSGAFVVSSAALVVVPPSEPQAAMDTAIADAIISAITFFAFIFSLSFLYLFAMLSSRFS